MKKKINLFLDDVRNPKDVTWVELPLVEWTIVRNYDDFVNAVKTNSIIICSFDHDMFTEHYQEYHRVHQTGFKDKIDYTRFKEKTGYDCALFLANYCVENLIPIPQYYIHTLNGPGGANIHSIMESARKIINESLEKD